MKAGPPARFGAAAAPVANPQLEGAPLWRREPYRVFFPLGVLMAWGGVLHWLLHAIGALENYQPVFHALTQIQGFLMSFAVGFLFTAVPRRTGTSPPAAWEMAIGIAAPMGTAWSAWSQRWALSQAFWIALLAVLLAFVLRRFVSERAARRPPNSFVWVPLALLMGLAGSVLIGVAGVRGPDFFWYHDLGRLFLLQGMFLGLVAGIGGMVLPLITHGESSVDAGPGRRDRAARGGHVAAAALIAGSFWIENSGWPRSAALLRAGVMAAELIITARLARPPSVPGWHRRLVWLAAWLIPAGYVLAALFPLQRAAGLHVVFVGGFALLTFSVGLHVTLAHGGYGDLVRGRSWQVAAYGGLFLLAMVLRALVEFDPARFYPWLGASAASFLLATLFWGALALPRMRSAPGSPDPAGRARPGPRAPH
jgi:uncharacterized protein involved in response to NO